MSFFGDLVKTAKKGLKKIKEVGGQVARATRGVRPLIAGLGPVGAGVSVGLTALDPGDERARKKAGRPAGRGIITPRFLQAQVRFLQRTQAAAVRQATGRQMPVAPAPLVPTRTAATVRTVPTRAMQARMTGLPRRPIMPMVPRGQPIPAQPAGLRFQVPQVLKERARQLRENLPFAFGAAPDAPATRALVPLTESVDKIGRPLIVQVELEQRVRCPPGYLAVTMPDGSRACVLAGVAIAAGLAKRRRKPLISVKETRAMQVADRARSKLKRVTTKAGFTVRERRTTRGRSRGK